MGNMQMEQDIQYDNIGNNDNNNNNNNNNNQPLFQLNEQNMNQIEEIEELDNLEQKLLLVKKLNNNVLYTRFDATRDVCDDSIMYNYLLKRIDRQWQNNSSFIQFQYQLELQKKQQQNQQLYQQQQQIQNQGNINNNNNNQSRKNNKQLLVQYIQHKTIQTANYVGFKKKNHDFEHLWVGWGDNQQIISHKMLINSKDRFDEFNGEHFCKTINREQKYRPTRWFYSVDSFKWQMPYGKEFFERKYINNSKQATSGSEGSETMEPYQVHSKQLICKDCHKIKKNGLKAIHNLKATFLRIQHQKLKTVQIQNNNKTIKILNKNNNNNQQQQKEEQNNELENKSEEQKNFMPEQYKYVQSYFRKDIWVEIFSDFLI